MQLDAQTLQEIRTLLARDCDVEINVIFHDRREGGEAVEPVEISAYAELDADMTDEERLEELSMALDDLKDVLRGEVLTDVDADEAEG